MIKFSWHYPCSTFVWRPSTPSVKILPFCLTGSLKRHLICPEAGIYISKFRRTYITSIHRVTSLIGDLQSNIPPGYQTRVRSRKTGVVGSPAELIWLKSVFGSEYDRPERANQVCKWRSGTLSAPSLALNSLSTNKYQCSHTPTYHCGAKANANRFPESIRQGDNLPVNV